MKSFQALYALGPHARAAIPALRRYHHPALHRSGGQGFDSYHAKVAPCIAAATVLRRIAPEDEDILPTLLEALNDREEPDKRMRTAAIEMLGDVGLRAELLSLGFSK